jgi:murein DD-endopeptidase MepM/ murein hydrolase activator NlpD
VPRVQVGDVVRTGQVIGAVGATGNVTGPHLHLEVRVKGSPIDPEVWLHKQGLLND